MAMTKRICAYLFRLLVLGATASAAIVMAVSHETAHVFFLTTEAKYTHMPAFKYFVIANAIASVYSLLVLLLPQQSPLWRLVLALDVVVAMLLASSSSAALAIAYVGLKGNTNAGWQPICKQVPHYCNHVEGALAAGFVGFAMYGAIVLSSIHDILDPLLTRKS
ncbi:hypothetical protein Drorol1_Dr00003948 [Drosera rotundifolia]